MFLDLPLELQASVIRNLHADDLVSLLEASAGLFDCLFETYTDCVESKKTYFGTHGSPWESARHYGLVNLIHITSFLGLDHGLFFQRFGNRSNIVVLELKQTEEDEFFDYDNSVNKDPHRLNEFLKIMTRNSTILLMGLDKGFPLNLDEFDSQRISISRSPCVDIHGGEGLSHGITCSSVKDALLQHVSQGFLCESDFSVTPYEALILSPGNPCVVSYKDVAAAVLLITNLRSLSNIKMKGKRLTILYSSEIENSSSSFDNIFAPDLLFLFVQFHHIDYFPLIENIETPNLEQAWFRNEDLFPMETADPSLSMDFGFLSTVKDLTLEGVIGPLVKCPTFNYLVSLKLSLTNSLPPEFELYCPVLESLEISGSSLRLIPELEAPYLTTFKLHQEQGINTDQGMASNLPKVLSYYRQLIHLELKVSGVNSSVYRGVDSYLKSMGSKLESIVLSGVSLDVFEDRDLQLPNLQKLSIKGTGYQDIDKESLSMSFNGPQLQEIEVGSFLLKRLWVRNFPLLSAFSSTISLPELHLENVPELEKVKVDGLISSLHAEDLSKLRRLAYNVQFGKFQPADVERHVRIMNPKVKRTIKRVR